MRRVECGDEGVREGVWRKVGNYRTRFVNHHLPSLSPLSSRDPLSFIHDFASVEAWHEGRIHPKHGQTHVAVSPSTL